MIYERRHTRLDRRLRRHRPGGAGVQPRSSRWWRCPPSACPASTGSWASSWCCSAASAPIPLATVHRHDRRHLRRGLPALGAAADHLQPARQPGERDADGSDRARAGGAWSRCSSASSGWGSIPGRCCSRMEPAARRYIELTAARTRSASPVGRLGIGREVRADEPLDLGTPFGVTLALLPELLLCRLVADRPAGGELAARDRRGQPARRGGSASRVWSSAAARRWLALDGRRPPGGLPSDDRARRRSASRALALILLAAGGTILLSLGYLERERLLCARVLPAGALRRRRA